MKLNKKTRYTVEILVYLASAKDVVQIPTAAEQLKIPISNLRKIIKMLQEKNYVKTVRGYQGGVKLIAEPKDVDFYKIFLETENITEEKLCLTNCAGCVNNDNCRFGYTVSSRYNNFINSFKGLTLEDLLNNK